MKKYLENLHARPAHEKRRFSMRVAGAITLGVFFVWFSTLGLRIANLSNEHAAPSGASDMVAAVGAVGQEIQQGFGQIRANLTVVGAQNDQVASTTPPPAAPASAPATVLSGSPDATQ